MLLLCYVTFHAPILQYYTLRDASRERLQEQERDATPFSTNTMQLHVR